MGKRNILSILLCIFFVLVFYLYAFAEITVTSVKGQAKYKTGKQWVNMTQGMKLAEGTKVSTGVNSSVTLNVNDSTVIIRQMSMIKIEENSLTADESNTRIGLKRGGLNARISKIKTLKTTFKITTPVATSSVRGTQEEVFYGPGSGMIVKVLEGDILAENKFGSGNIVHGKLGFRQDNRRSTPDDPNSGRREEARGGLINILTDDERIYMENSSDLFITPDQNSAAVFVTAGGVWGIGNIKITPVFP